jgi:hypothetical protein
MNANKINYYPNQIFDKYGLCMCGDCLSCRPDLFPIKPNQCVVCNCYNLSEFKKVERKHIHCLDCYKQVMNAKRKEQRKQKREEYTCECCGEYDKHSVALATGENGVEMRVCRFCDVDGSNYDGWGDDDEEEDEESVYVCKGCGENIGDNGFCTEGCRFGEFAGVWTCDCGRECEDVEFCPDCPREEESEEEEAKPKNEWEDFLNLCDKPCKCTDAMDIRGRCGIGKIGFAKCPAFADTACFCICNDSDLDMKIRASEDLGINCTPIITQWLSDHNVPADLHEPILNLYNEWRVDEYESPNVYPYKKCSDCGERKSCGSYQDDCWFCEDCAEEECTDENRCEDCTHCARTKPCSCGCGVLGGSCDRGVAIDNGEVPACATCGYEMDPFLICLLNFGNHNQSVYHCTECLDERAAAVTAAAAALAKTFDCEENKAESDDEDSE